MTPPFPTAEDVAVLLEWFAVNRRKYPWSFEGGGAPDAYGVWVSEVMLQQTTAAAVMPRYERWMKRFPDIDSLAAASRDEVLNEWEGLGYYSRAGNLHSAARETCRAYGGKLPREEQELRKLPGVGNYTASAVASIAFGHKTAVIDANVRRIVQRLEGRECWGKDIERSFKKEAERNMPEDNPGRFNIALMQFGQLLCLPRGPGCGKCPLSGRCAAAALGIQNEIPLRRHTELTERLTDIVLAVQGGRVWVRRRRAGITAGLWSFPAFSELDSPGLWRAGERLESRLHCYTRFRDELRPRIYHRASAASDGENPTSEGLWVDEEALKALGMPSVHRLIAGSLWERLRGE
ncbi:MAG: hypothetical protein B0D92_01950 [Spirochaeta sp. LUC14_002_19_P3]|nr:MAG: hypothetical protein B0D92_01950 [Spirochaeta sp. LUC14_002_19_P3]